MAKENKILSDVLRIFIKVVFAYQRRIAKTLGFEDVLPGAVTMIQRFGSSLNHHLHFHSIIPDGVFVDPGKEAALCWVDLPPPSPEDINHLIRKLRRKIFRYISKQEDLLAVDDDDDDAMSHTVSQAIQIRLPKFTPTDDHASKITSPLCAMADGFSLHAGGTVQAKDREGLLRLCRYGKRAPFSIQQFSRLENGNVRFQLKRSSPHVGGATHLVMEPKKVIRRLITLIPPPYSHSTRYFGVFAPNFRRRNEVNPSRV